MGQGVLTRHQQANHLNRLHEREFDRLLWDADMS